MSKSILKHSYLILAFGLIAIELIHIIRGHWSGDFWEHSAVINELSKDLFHPKNPIINTSTPHAFFSPYAVIVAFFSKTLSLSSIQSLACFSFINLILFLGVFFRFCKSLFKEHAKALTSISFVFILLFWGIQPHRWSGFYHVYGLHHVLSYPSTFAMILSLFVLTIVITNQKSLSIPKTIFIILLNATVVITHPTTAIFLFICLLVVFITLKKGAFFNKFKIVLLLILPSIAVTFLWPYFSFISLFTSDVSDFHSDSHLLYTNAIYKYWPLLLGFLALPYYKKNRVVQFLILSSTFLLIVFILGYVLNIYGISRVISNAMMLNQILLAYLLVIWIKKRLLLKASLLSLFFTLAVIINFNPLKRVFNVFYKSDNSYYEQFRFLNEYVLPYDVILSDSSSNWIIPSFNGKVIASGHPLYWVDDIKMRRNDISCFFEASTTNSIREGILKKYKVNYVLIDYSKSTISYSASIWLKHIGTSIYKKHTIELIKILH